MTSATHTHSHTHQDDDEKTLFGFWIYIMTDCILFAAIFAVYAVLQGATFGGPGPKELFSMPYVLVETFLLLTSSFTFGLAMLALHQKKQTLVLIWMFATFLLGLGFIGMEINEFASLVQEGHSWRSNAYMSAFFTLVGTHGLHVTCGLIWMVLLMMQIQQHGLSPLVSRKLGNLSLFWHFLDIVWIFVFTIVYLMGVA